MNFDYRDVAANTDRWYEHINTKNMTVIVNVACDEESLENLKEDLSEEAYNLIDENGCVILPMKFKVCSTCNGKGTHVNPSIDSHGITEEEWNRDWSYEEQETYLSGGYDIACYECHGEKVVPEININSYNITNPMREIIEIIDSNIREEMLYTRSCMMERALGA